jgi:inner membrane protein
MNTYGLRWLMPFADRWFYGDALFIVDPWLWGVLGLGTLASWWLGSGRRRRDSWARPARVALALATIYTVAMLALGQAGRGLVRDQFAARGVQIVGDPMVSPIFADPFIRYTVASDGARYYVAAVRWWPRPRLDPDTRVIPRNDTHPAVAAARDAPAARGFLNWSRFPFYTVRDDGASVVITMDDARYAPAGGTSWAAVEVRVPRQSASGAAAVARAVAPEPGAGRRAFALLAAWCGN